MKGLRLSRPKPGVVTSWPKHETGIVVAWAGRAGAEHAIRVIEADANSFRITNNLIFVPVDFKFLFVELTAGHRDALKSEIVI